MTHPTLRIATRKSPLALWQANFVAAALKRHWPTLNITLVSMTTSGDRFLQDSLAKIGGKGLFVKELEQALLDNRADLAVHSMKDVPSQLPDSLMLAAMMKRDSPYDALISMIGHTLETLPPNSTIGTSSLRRQTQLLHARPDLNPMMLRGNIHTRLEKLHSGQYDAIVLAEAGLERMDMQQHITQTLDDHLMLPACGQGALGIECRADDPALLAYLEPLNDADTTCCVNVEREVNALLGGHCHAPLAVYCVLKPQGTLWLRAKLLSEDGQTVLYDERTGARDDGLALAKACANALFDQGAKLILECVP